VRFEKTADQEAAVIEIETERLLSGTIAAQFSKGRRHHHTLQGPMAAAAFAQAIVCNFGKVVSAGIMRSA
jgi:hypothetical protein